MIYLCNKKKLIFKSFKRKNNKLIKFMQIKTKLKIFKKLYSFNQLKMD